MYIKRNKNAKLLEVSNSNDSSFNFNMLSISQDFFTVAKVRNKEDFCTKQSINLKEYCFTCTV